MLLTRDVAIIAFPIITLVLGLLIGYLAQRSGFCSVGGMRDLMMFKQTRLFFGYLGLIVSALVSYWIFSLIIPAGIPKFLWFANNPDPLTPIPGAPAGLTPAIYVLLAIIGGLGLGIMGVYLGGCPLRQTIMGAEGNIKSMFFVLGMCIGAVIFHLWISAWVVEIFT